jgi:excisionase family DNA binding protein
MSRNLLTADQVAEMLSVSRKSIYKWAESGAIPSVKLPGGRAVRFDPQDVERIIEAGRRKSN